MTTAYSSKGRTVGIDVQTSLTEEPTGAFGEIRLEEPVTIPTDEKMVVAQPNVGHANAMDWGDQPVTYEGVRTDAVTLPITFRQGNATGVQSPLATMAESGGCAVVNTIDDVVDVYTDLSNFSITTGYGADDAGFCTTVVLDDGTFYPALVNNYTESTKAVTLQMDLPSAASGTNATQSTDTILPQTGQVDNAKLLSLLVSTRGAHTGTEDLAWYLRACALSSFGEISIEPGAAEAGIIKVSPTYHAAKVEQSAVALAAESFIDSDKVQHISNNLVFEFGDYADGGELTHANLELLKATITLNHTTIPIPGEGSTSTLNGIQGYMAQTAEQPTVVLEVLMDKAYWADFKLATQTEKHIGFVMPSTLAASPAWGIWLPRCYQSASPVADLHGSEYIKATLTYSATSPDFDSETANNSGGTSPWFMALTQK